jgi:hypothetical protein
MKITKFEVLENKYIVHYSENDDFKNKEFDSFEETIDFLHDLGYRVSSVEYMYLSLANAFSKISQEFTENVAICGMPRGYRENSPIVDDKPILDPEISIEEVMAGFAPIYYKDNQ